MSSSSSSAVKRSSSAAALVELSSAEEEDDKRHRNRRRPKALTNVTQMPAPVAPSGAVYITIPEEQHPNMKTIRELVAEHVHLDIKKSCDMAVNKLSSKQRSNASTQNIDVLRGEMKIVDHERAAQVNPWQHELFQQKLSQLPRPEYFFRSIQIQLSHDELIAGLRRKQLHVPLLTARYEQDIMGESGTFTIADGVTRTYPQCKRGDQCVTNVYNIPDPDNVGRFVGTSLMYPEEKEEYAESGIPVGFQPRPCVLCCREILCDWVLFLRSMTMANESEQSSEKSAANFKYVMDKNHVYQLYRNLIDQKDGYYREYMLIPRADECIVDPICMFTISVLKLKRLSNGRRTVDQRAMMYGTGDGKGDNAKPVMGETVLNF